MEDYKKYVKEAELLKALAHPVRLCIAKGLMDGRCNVNKMKDCLGVSQSNVSQHLSKLKSIRYCKI